MAGAVNHDRQPFAPHVDVWWDLEEPSPNVYLGRDGRYTTASISGVGPAERLTGRFDEVHARDVLEHVPPNRFYTVLDSMWVQLREGGRAFIQVPEANSRNALIDPTHWRGFQLESFDFLDPQTRLGKACWTTKLRWRVLQRRRLPRTDVNLAFILEKIAC